MLDNMGVVLVRPMYGGNVGSVCRAMANMGLKSLSLVAPRELDLGEARMMACHAWEIFEGRREYGTLSEAVSDCVLVMGTTARDGLYRQHARTPREWAPRALAAAELGRVALVFGPEDNGLTNEELALSTEIVQIPSSDGYLSLNLAQAVMICCYEVFVATGCYEPIEEKSAPATGRARDRMYELWREMLLEIGFMNEEKADHMMQGLRRVFARGVFTDDDARIMMGVAKQALWASGKRKKVVAAAGVE